MIQNVGKLEFHYGVKWCVCDSITLQTLFSCVTRMYYTSEKYFHHYINWLLSTPIISP